MYVFPMKRFIGLKKIFGIVVVAAIIGGVYNVIKPKTESHESHEFDMFLHGKFGGESDAMLQLKNGRGWYEYESNKTHFERDIVFERYDKNTDSLIISAYYKGTKNYLGQFKGILVVEEREKTYSGFFLNHKGDSAEFKLQGW